MSIYFDVKTIRELIGDTYFREVETYDFSPDDWIRYITPLVNKALEEYNGGKNLEHLFQKYIMIGVLVGQEKTFKEAINEVEKWEKTGVSQLLDKTNIVQAY